MVQKVNWSQEAFHDLERINSFISIGSKFHAFHVINKIISTAENIALFPYSGRVVTHYQNEKIRERIYHQFRIVYEIRNKNIFIVAIYHSAQNKP